jgi:hypothetical protein
MQINSAGLVIGGVGFAGVYVAPGPSTVVAPPSGNCGWLSEDVCLYQSDDNELRACNIVTGDDIGFGDRRGVTLIRGANGQYGVWTAGQGVRGSVNQPTANGILGAADDGTLFLISQDYSAIEAYTDGVLRWRYEQSWPVIYYPAPQFSCLDADRCCWWNAQANRLQTRGLGLAPANTWGMPIDPFVAEIGGVVYIGYHSDRFYLHPYINKYKGWIVATDDTYYTCGRTFADRIRCAWSTDPSEINLQVRDIDPLTEPMIDLTPTYDPIVAIGRPVWQGFIEFGIGTTSPGNSYLEVPPIGSEPDPTFRAYVCALGGTKLYRYVQADNDSDVDALEDAIARAKRQEPTMPVMAYWTLKAQSIRVPFGADAVLVEGYWKVGETLAQLEQRIRAAMARHPTPWIAAQCYTSNSGNQTDLRAVVPVYARILRDTGAGCLAFSDGNRATGWSDHPEVHQDWHTLNNGIPSAPPIPYPPIPEVPAMNIGQTIMARRHDRGPSEPADPAPRGDFVKMVVIDHQDRDYLDPITIDGKPVRNRIYGVSQDFPGGATNKVYSFTSKGEIDPVIRPVAGAAERVTFDGDRFMVVRPNCGKNGAGVSILWDVIKL